VSNTSQHNDLDELLQYNPNLEAGEQCLFPCRSCGDLHVIECDPEDFCSDMHYCGKSERCIP